MRNRNQEPSRASGRGERRGAKGGQREEHDRRLEAGHETDWGGGPQGGTPNGGWGHGLGAGGLGGPYGQGEFAGRGPFQSGGQTYQERSGNPGGYFGNFGGYPPGGMAGPGEAGAVQREFDREYLRWRDEQMRRFDDDYRSWCQERYGKFCEEFDAWRRGREPGRSGERGKRGGK